MHCLYHRWIWNSKILCFWLWYRCNLKNSLDYRILASSRWLRPSTDRLICKCLLLAINWKWPSSGLYHAFLPWENSVVREVPAVPLKELPVNQTWKAAAKGEQNDYLLWSTSCRLDKFLYLTKMIEQFNGQSIPDRPELDWLKLHIFRLSIPTFIALNRF